MTRNRRKSGDVIEWAHDRRQFALDASLMAWGSGHAACVLEAGAAAIP